MMDGNCICGGHSIMWDISAPIPCGVQGSVLHVL